MNRKNILLTLLAILFGFATAKGQENLVINFADNSSVATALSDIQKITFGSDNMILKTTNGHENSYLLDDVTFITFLDGVGIDEQPAALDVSFFINGFGEIVVETPYHICQLTVFDITGREVATGAQNKLNVNFLNTGIYILQVTTDKSLVSKKFIKNR